MNNTDAIRVFLTMFLSYLPTFIVCLVAGVVVLTRWQEVSAGAMWAVMGFGLAALLCLLLPAVQVVLQHWVFQTGEREARMWAFTALSFVSAVLHAAIYVMLLVAIFAGRAKPGIAIPPSMSRPL
jgi:hypothetical protein